MSGLFNVWRSGYLMGEADAQAKRRHRAEWELRYLRPLNWVPGVDVESFMAGYAAGYANVMAGRTWQGRAPGGR